MSEDGGKRKPYRGTPPLTPRPVSTTINDVSVLESDAATVPVNVHDGRNEVPFSQLK